MHADQLDHHTPDQRRSRVLFHTTAIGLGVVMLVIGLVTHQAAFGVTGIVVMVGYSAVLWLLARRSETAELLSGAPYDERQQQVMTKALASTAQVLVVVLVGWFLVATARGADNADTLSTLCAIGGVTLMASVAYYRRRG